MGLETAIPIAIKAGMTGLGALGGLGSGGNELYSFANATGDSGFGGDRSVDPGDLLGNAMGLADMMRGPLMNLASQPTQLGPASIYQTPPFSFGGALPAPIGIGIQDPGFLQRPGMDFGGTGLGYGGGGGGHQGGGNDTGNGGRKDEDGTGGAGGPGGGGGGGGGPIPYYADPVDPRRGGGPEAALAALTGPSAYAAQTTAPQMGGMPGMMPTNRGELQGFLDAVNVAMMGQKPPYVLGGLG